MSRKIARVLRPCACGCARPVLNRDGKGMPRRYASPACAKRGFWTLPEYAASRQQLRIGATRARRERAHARALEKAGPDARAYERGYQAGYARAMNWWRRKFQRSVARSA